MQFVIPLNEFRDDCIHFNHRTENTVVSGGGFHKTLYCTKNASLIGIPVSFGVQLQGYGLDETGMPKGQMRTARLAEECEDHVRDIVIPLLRRIHESWSKYSDNKRPLSLGPTISLVKQSVSKAFERVEPTVGSVYHFVFKCSGLFDTEHDSGITFRLLSVRGEELHHYLHHGNEDKVEKCQNHSN